MGLKAYILKRLLYTIVLIFAVISVNFIIFMMMPGDPAEYLISSKFIGRADVIASLREQWGLDKPLHIRYGKYVVSMLTGQFGYSYRTQAPVSLEVVERLKNTLFLIIPPEAAAVILGIVLGAVAAQRRGKLFDNLSVISSLTLYALPVFWIAMVLIMIFAHNLGWFPSAHSQPDYWFIHPPTSILEDIGIRLKHLILPWVTLFLLSFGGYVLLTRASVLEAITEDYVLTARAKGLKERAILFKHALKNALLPIITDIAIAFGFTLSGAIITESVFRYPGLGWWIWTAIENNDYPVLQAIFFIVALCVIAANFLTDIIYGFIDPRIRYG